MAELQGPGTSKSAKRRAAKKANALKAADEEEEEEEAPPPAPEPKAKAKAKPEAKAAATPKADPKSQAKAQPKAQPKVEPAPKAEPKAEPKAKTEPKAAAKGKAKGKAAAQPVEEEPPKKKEEFVNYVMDDGTGGEWEKCTGMTKRQEKKDQKRKEEEAYLKELRAQQGGAPLPKNTVPGMAPLDPRAAAANKAAISQAAAADVARILATKGPEEEKPVANLSVAIVNVPDHRIGVVIGPKGANIKMIQEKTKVTRIDTVGGVFTISGPGSGVAEAEAAITELVDKGYCSMLYDDFSENFVNVHPSYFPDIIGSKGAVIQKIKKDLKVEVNIPTIPPDPPASKKFKVTLAGSTKQVEEAEECINSIMMYNHHEITHPGHVHAELEVDRWSLRYIIGKGGCEITHPGHVHAELEVDR